jgi:hypothetical protein
LLKALKENEGDIKGADLFSQVRDGVTEKFPQVPQYGAVLSAGHEAGGDFIFTGSGNTSQ